ncbi:hypothetical protein A0H81_04301 [Grifola frondosa]|uniref:DUF7918 domain-containing protein n=1 Tax=Grifola frondosa TaxID=5627 RepID=A0A1C7MH68_GRIFR|nr:hypothetical protein A0H81_04301 [Grifola frondosa]
MVISSTLSDILGYTSIGCWLGAQFPQVLENARRQSVDGLALPFLLNWLLGESDVTNLVGCILTHQLPFQTYLAAYFCFVDFSLLGQYFYYRSSVKPIGPPPYFRSRSRAGSLAAQRLAIERGTIVPHYRALSTVAANVAAAAALAAKQEEHSRWSRNSLDGHPHTADPNSEFYDDDEVSEEALARLADSFHSEGGRSGRRKRVSWSQERGGSLGRDPSSVLSPPGHIHATLHMTPHVGQVDEVATLSRDPRPSLEHVIGRISAWICTTLYLTSRLPQIWKNFVRKSVEGLSMYLFVFAFLGNLFYVASILTSPNLSRGEAEASAFIKESIPYLLGSGGTLMFDVTIVTQSYLYRPKAHVRGRRGSRTDEEEAGLLSAGATGAEDVVTRSRRRTGSVNGDAVAPADSREIMPLELHGYSVYISCDGKEIEQCDVREDDAKTVSCWIPSEAGKEFEIYFGTELKSTMMVDIAMDGRKMISLAYHEQRWGKSPGCYITSTTFRPYIFSNITLTDDDGIAVPTAGDKQALGLIEVALRRTYGFTRQAFIQSKIPDNIGPIHERSKKGGTHCVSLGDAKPAAAIVTCIPSHVDTEPFATFRFRYRPRELLQATGIIPLPVKPSSPSGPSSSNKRPSNEDVPSASNPPNAQKRARTVSEDGDTKPTINVDDDEEILTLEKQLRNIQERLQRKKAKKNSSRPIKRETSPIRACFVPGEVIDLT